MAAELTTSRPPGDGSEPDARSDEIRESEPLTIGEPSSDPVVDLDGSVKQIQKPVCGPVPAVSRAKGQAHVAFVGHRGDWVKALVRRDEGAAVAFFDEYSGLVERTVSRILGVDADIADATQDAFMRCLQSVHRLKDPQAMTQWVIQIAVYTATDWVRRRDRRRWLTFRDPTDLAKYPTSGADSASRDALHATYAILDQLTAEERAAFALRFIEGMELKELALACSCSLSTIKRRLARAELRFEAIARNDPILSPWLSEARAERAGA